MSKVPVPGPLELKLSQPLEWYDTGARVFKTLNSSTSSEPSSGSARLQASMSNVLATTTFTVSSKRTRRGWFQSENEVLRDNGMAPIDRRRVFVLQSHEFALKTTVNEQQLEPTRPTPVLRIRYCLARPSKFLRLSGRLRLLVTTLLQPRIWTTLCANGATGGTSLQLWGWNARVGAFEG